MKFIILCYPRTGSTLLITALGAHPNINQGMEIFNPEQEGNDPWVHRRKATFAALYGSHDSYLNADGNLASFMNLAEAACAATEPSTLATPIRIRT